MPPIWKPQPFEVLKHWVDTIIDEASDSLNDWETKFIDEMQIKIINKWSLTQAQEEKLESIYAQKTS